MTVTRQALLPQTIVWRGPGDRQIRGQNKDSIANDGNCKQGNQGALPGTLGPDGSVDNGRLPERHAVLAQGSLGEFWASAARSHRHLGYRFFVWKESSALFWDNKSLGGVGGTRSLAFDV